MGMFLTCMAPLLRTENLNRLQSDPAQARDASCCIMRSNACNCTGALTSPCALFMTRYGAAGPPGHGAEGPPQPYHLPNMQPAVCNSPACRLYSLRPDLGLKVQF